MRRKSAYEEDPPLEHTINNCRLSFHIVVIANGLAFSLKHLHDAVLVESISCGHDLHTSTYVRVHCDFARKAQTENSVASLHGSVQT